MLSCADPSMMPKMQVDKGAVKFVLRGSNVMCQGLTSPGGRMEDVPANTVVVGFATKMFASLSSCRFIALTVICARLPIDFEDMRC